MIFLNRCKDVRNDIFRNENKTCRYSREEKTGCLWTIVTDHHQNWYFTGLSLSQWQLHIRKHTSKSPLLSDSPHLGKSADQQQLTLGTTLLLWKNTNSTIWGKFLASLRKTVIYKPSPPLDFKQRISAFPFRYWL